MLPRIIKIVIVQHHKYEYTFIARLHTYKFIYNIYIYIYIYMYNGGDEMEILKYLLNNECAYTLKIF